MFTLLRTIGIGKGAIKNSECPHESHEQILAEHVHRRTIF